MKYVDEYRDGAAARKLAEAIARTVTRPWTIVEICGGQTHTIVKYGISIGCFLANVELVHGPGLSGLRYEAALETIDRAHAIAVAASAVSVLLLRRHAPRPRTPATAICSR